MKFKSLLAVSLLSSLTMVQTANAKDSGLFVGAGIGVAAVEIDGTPIGTYDESEAAWKIFGGYTLGSFLGFEVAYVSLGDGSASVANQTVDVDISGISGFAVVGLPIGPVRAFIKGGGINWDADVDWTGDETGSLNEDGTDFAAGIGLEFSLFSVAMRAEVEYFDIEDGAGMASLGATWTF
jgi:hypothetical protein